MSAFLPSVSGFAFLNSWPSAPVAVVRTPFGKVRLGDARGGLCGGMVFAALDFWLAGARPPDDRPAQGDALYAFFIRRLMDSWHLPSGVARYYRWMARPDAGTGGVGWLTISRELPRIRRALADGNPVPLGVVTAASGRLGDLGLNHQVLAYASEVTGEDVTLRVYDPNRGQRDDIAIRFSVAAPAGRTTFAHDLGLDQPVRGLFAISYRAVTPPVG